MRNLDCPTFERKPFVSGPPLARTPHRGRDLGRPRQARRAALRFGRCRLPGSPRRHAFRPASDEPRVGQFRPYRVSARHQCRLSRSIACARWRPSGHDRIGGVDALFLYGRDRSARHGGERSCRRGPAESRSGGRGVAHACLTPLHARRERARLFPGRRRHSDGGDQPHSGADGEGWSTPRSLWVPFELGRPLGRAEGRGHFRKTSSPRHWVSLRRRRARSLLEDYPRDDPTAVDFETGSPPFDLRPSDVDSADQPASSTALAEEVRAVAPSYERFVAANRRTTFGISGLDIEDVRGLSRLLSRGSSARPIPLLRFPGAGVALGGRRREGLLP